MWRQMYSARAACVCSLAVLTLLGRQSPVQARLRGPSLHYACPCPNHGPHPCRAPSLHTHSPKV